MNKTIKKFFRKLTKRPKEIDEQPVDAKRDSKVIKKPQDVPKPVSPAPPITTQLVDVKELYEIRMQRRKTILSLTTQVQPCVKAGAFSGNLALVDHKNKEVINFDKQIGSKSVYGIAYMVTALAENPLKISIKIMKVTDEHRLEGDLLNKMTNLAINQYTPNLPMTYHVLECTGDPEEIQPSIHSKVQPAALMHSKNYFLIMNELATGDGIDYLKQAHTDLSYTSIVFQMIFGIQAFHQLGYSHNDTHPGNFLYHTNISLGGLWQYQYKDTIICVPNLGHLMVLWDPGFATPLDENNENEDFLTIMMHVYEIDKDDIKAGFVPIDPKMKIYKILQKLYNRFRLSRGKDIYFMDYLIDIIKRGEINSTEHFILTNKDLPNISTFPAPFNYLINDKPYPLEFTYTE